jgi:hypothetical protein
MNDENSGYDPTDTLGGPLFDLEDGFEEVANEIADM